MKSEKTETWVQFRCFTRAVKASLPGVWRLKSGGFLIRGRATSPATGKRIEICRATDHAAAQDAYRELQAEIARARQATVATPTRMRFVAFSDAVFDERLATDELGSQATIRNWRLILGKHLCLPYTPGSAGEYGFGDVYIDQLTSQMVADWRARMGSLVKSGVVSPRTVNEYINKLRLIMSLAHRRVFTSRNPCLDLKHLPTNPTYTEEEPNSLTPAETAVLLEKIWDVYPEWYAYSVLGFTTGLRPSSLRPLRRAGSTPDIVFMVGQGTQGARLYVRRSHVLGDVVRERTKTGIRQSITLPPCLADVLLWHIGRFNQAQLDSGLLFPDEAGKLFNARTTMRFAMPRAARLAGITKHISPRCMRRTYQDLQRAVSTPDVVVRSISGHVTEDMQRHYSSVAADEQAASIDRMGMLLQFPGRRGVMRGAEDKEPQEVPERKVTVSTGS